MSVVSYESLTDVYRQRLVESAGAVGANGMPLDIVGRTTMILSLGSFNAEKEFTVIRNLTVECLLGADFLKEHGAVMDYTNSVLSLGKGSRFDIPIYMGRQCLTPSSPPPPPPPTSLVAVRAPMDMEIPGHVIQLICGELQGDLSCFGENKEALVEPINGSPPTHISVTWTLSCVLSGNQVALQIMNTSPTPVTIYKGMKLGEVTPRHNVLLVDQVVTAVEHEHSSPEINLDSTDLTESEKA